MISTTLFIVMMLLLPVACVACFLLGAWVHHAAGTRISPLPSIPFLGKINVTGGKPAADKAPEPKPKAVL